jgi:hypothetical protein
MKLPLPRSRTPGLRLGLGCAILAVMGGFGVFAQEPSGYVSPPEKLPREIGPQPVAFSHKKHSGSGINCQDCHVTVKGKARAGLPRLSDCMICHQTIATGHPEVQKLDMLVKQKMKVEWVRAYQVPDFVVFSHKKHMAAKLECNDCHGPVETRDVMAQELSTSMTACMNCHAQRNVSNECYFCHDLGQ